MAKKNYKGGVLLAILGVVVTVVVARYSIDLYKDFQYSFYAKERQIEADLSVEKFNSDFNKLDTEEQESLKLSLAKIIKAVESSGNPNLSPSEISQIELLVSSAIGEAKKVAAANPENPTVWFYLGDIYGYLVGAVEGADTWAIDSFKKAASLDPENYSYHIRLGRVYFKTEQYALAIEKYQQVTELNPYFANGHYNLGMAYKEYGAKAKAKTSFKKVLDLLPSDSSDRYKAEKEFESI